MKNSIFTLIACLTSIFITQSVTAQDCQSEIPVSREVLSENKVKQIRMYQSDTLTGKRKLAKEFFVDSTGYVFRLNNYENPEQDGYFTRRECECNKDSTIHTFRTYSVSPKGISSIISTVERKYNTDKKLIKLTEEIHLENKTILSIFHIKPSAPDDIFHELYEFSDNDTLHYEKELSSPTINDKTKRTKVNGNWIEERFITEYMNGKYFSYREYKNGRLVKSHSVKDDKYHGEYYTEDPVEYPKMPVQKEYSDTIVIQTSPLKKYRITGLSTSSSTKSILKISHYSDYKKGQLSYTQYYYTNGLILLYYQPGIEYVEVYEYLPYSLNRK